MSTIYYHVSNFQQTTQRNFMILCMKAVDYNWSKITESDLSKLLSLRRKSFEMNVFFSYLLGIFLWICSMNYSRFMKVRDYKCKKMIEPDISRKKILSLSLSPSLSLSLSLENRPIGSLNFGYMTLK